MWHPVRNELINNALLIQLTNQLYHMKSPVIYSAWFVLKARKMCHPVRNKLTDNGLLI